MKKQFLKALIEKKGEGVYSFIASTSVIDRQGESIDQAGWELENYKKNPVILWAHDYSKPPLGKSEVSVDGQNLLTEITFASEEANPFAQQMRKLVDEGILNTLSVGFIPKERQGHIITRAELLEISLVPVPANPEALALVRSMKGFEELADILAKNMEDFPADDDELDEEELGASDDSIIADEVLPVTPPLDVEETPADAEEKIGRVLSEKNKTKIVNAIGTLKDAQAVLEEMLNMSEPQKDADGIPEGKSNFVVIERSALEGLRDWVRHGDKANERALSALKETLA